MTRLFHRSTQPQKLGHPGLLYEPDHLSATDEISSINVENRELTTEPRPGHKTVTHLKRYPLVLETRDTLESIAASRVVLANTIPLVRSVVNSKPVKAVQPVTNVVDDIMASGLDLTEAIVPSLKTKTFSVLKKEFLWPVRVTVQYTKVAVNGVINAGNGYVYKPAHERIIKTRQAYNKKYFDTKGKPLIRGALDPVISPVNNVIESNTKKFFPKGRDVAPRSAFSCEFDRNLALSLNLASRATPVFERKFITVVTAPVRYLKHVNDVLNVHLDREQNLGPRNSFKAIEHATNHLGVEVATTLRTKFSRTSAHHHKHNEEAEFQPDGCHQVEGTEPPLPCVLPLSSQNLPEAAVARPEVAREVI